MQIYLPPYTKIGETPYKDTCYTVQNQIFAEKNISYVTKFIFHVVKCKFHIVK